MEQSCVVKEWKILQQYAEVSRLYKSIKNCHMYTFPANSVSWSFTPWPNSSQSQMHTKITCETSESSRCPDPTLALLKCGTWAAIFTIVFLTIFDINLTNSHSLPNIKIVLMKVTNEIPLFISIALSLFFILPVFLHHLTLPIIPSNRPWKPLSSSLLLVLLLALHFFYYWLHLFLICHIHSLF